MLVVPRASVGESTLHRGNVDGRVAGAGDVERLLSTANQLCSLAAAYFRAARQASDTLPRASRDPARAIGSQAMMLFVDSGIHFNPMHELATHWDRQSLSIEKELLNARTMARSGGLLGSKHRSQVLGQPLSVMSALRVVNNVNRCLTLRSFSKKTCALRVPSRESECLGP